jgi:uncharacterized protein YceH (UPF0502 family)
MMELTPDECRVLGTLIEKAMTTPAQYPLSLNSLVTGVNQKSNRDPVVEIDETRALLALDGLRRKGLARDVSFTGSRVEKFRHTAGEALSARGPELAVLAELLLRGPQTTGELRARASRMAAFDSIEAVEGTLASMATDSRGGESDASVRGSLVRSVAPLPGSRAPRWAQCLCHDLHAIGAGAETLAAEMGRASTSRAGDSVRVDALQPRVDALEARVDALAARVDELEQRLRALESRGQPMP